jgi:Flp pilus assembly pilin Flp
MDKLRSTVGILAVLASRPMPWLQATLARGPAGEEDNQGGQGLAEYALILAFIAIAAIAALLFFGQQLSGVLTDQVGKGVGDVFSNLPSLP